jgi:[protein-PII] uridylyltransferase
MSRKTTSRADRQLRYAVESTHSSRLAAIKTFLAEEHAEQLQQHRSGASGVQVVALRAATIDAVLENLFEYAMSAWRVSRGQPPSPVSLIALGGFGRSELCPLSDVDVMFLYPAKADHARIKDFEEHLNREILYLLWDASLKVGYSGRTTTEAFDEARGDMQTKTALSRRDSWPARWRCSRRSRPPTGTSP